jgi:pheromone shutdown-related protein TraB
MSQFSDNVTILEDGEKTYYLIGTAHISQKSVDEVADVIDEVRPDSVCVELCETRYKAMRDADQWKNLNIFQIIRQGKTLFLLANLALSSFQKKMGEKLGVKPGAEMVKAIEKAEAMDAELVLADRNIQATLKRTWHNVPFFKKISLMGGLLDGFFGSDELSEEELEQMKEKDQITEMMKEFAQKMPSVKKPLIDERDAFLMNSIEKAKGPKVVAVVGAGHMAGMITHFKEPVDLEALSEIPKPAKWVKLLKWIIPVMVLSAFYYGYSKNQGVDFTTMLQAWILPNAVFAALLTLIAGGKMLSVLTAFVASPITSLNPMLGAGMVVGLLEAWLRKPKVEDFERVNEDVRDIKGVYRNPVTRVLLVTVCSNLGSAIGAVVGLSWLVSLFS